MPLRKLAAPNMQRPAHRHLHLGPYSTQHSTCICRLLSHERKQQHHHLAGRKGRGCSVQCWQLLVRPRQRQLVVSSSFSAAAADCWPSDDPQGSKRQQQHKHLGTSLPATVFNLINVIMGAGYVSIPYACFQGGWAALAVLWLLGACFCYTGLVVLQCCKLVDDDTAVATAATAAAAAAQQKALPDATAAGTPEAEQPKAGYEAVAAAAFGQLGLAAVSSVMYAELLGICCVYVVLEAEILWALLSHTQLGMWLQLHWGSKAFGLLASLLMAPTVLLPDLAALSVLGAGGVAAAALVGLVLAVMFVSGGPAAMAAALENTSLLAPQTLPQVLGILAFVYAGHSTFPVIQRSMADPRQGPRAVVLGYLGTGLICTVLGAFGYALYGQYTASVITVNLPPGSLVALTCTVLTLANPFSAFAVTLEPVAIATQGLLTLSLKKAWHSSSNSSSGSGFSSGINEQARQQGDIMSGGGALATGDGGGGQIPPYPVRAAVRLGLALACCLAALMLPYVADLMAFVGALLTMSISLIIPALMHLRLMGSRLPWWMLLADVSVLLLGVVCAAVGASSALHNLQLKLIS